MFSFTHLVDNKQTYQEHLVDTFSFAARSLAAAIAFAIHGLWPSFLPTRGSSLIAQLNTELQRKRQTMEEGRIRVKKQA